MKEPVQLCYSISEASKLMNVEPHVLRYWEEELQLSISRNSMGHRIYTDDNLKTFRAIQSLKANHIPLKEIRAQLPVDQICSEPTENVHKMTQFKAILTDIIKDAIKENAKDFSNDISSQVSDDVRKELDFLARQREEQEDARFRQFDEALRTLQKTRQETAVADSTQPTKKRRFFFAKKK